MVDTPLMRQLEARECGAVALGIILAFYGKYVARAALRDACGVTRDGVTILGMVRAAEGYGLSAKVVKRQHLDGIEVPFVIYWNFNHFLVVEAVAAQGIQVNDPAYGRAFIPNALIERHFTGIVLTFRPTAAFVPEGHAAGKLPRDFFYPYLAVEIGRAVLDVGAVAGIVQQQFHPVLFFFAFAYVVLRLWSLNSLGHRYTASDRFRRLLALPVIFFSRIHVDELASRQLQMYVMGLAHAEAIQPFVYVGRVAIYVIGILLFASPFVITPVLAAVACWIAFYAAEQTKRLEAVSHIAREQFAGQAFNGILRVDAIKLQGGEEAFIQQLRRAQVAAYGQPFNLWVLLPILLPTLNLIALSVLAAVFVEMGAVSLPNAIIGFCLSLFIVLPAPAAGTAMYRIQDFRHQIERISDLPVLPTETQTPAVSRESISLEHVSFGYGDTRVIHDVTLDVHRSQSIGIVGRSGSGKSTLVHLIAGLYPPQQGTVHIPQSQFVLVDSNPFVVDATIAENISLFHSNIPFDAIERAARDSGLHDLVMRLPGGYQQRISQAAHPFSSGQLQCLEIARALVREPMFLLLDEATAAMDAITEAHVLANVARRGCGLLIISHRLSAIRSADEILVIEQGRIVERGTHAALLDSGQVYQQLIAGGIVR